MHTQFNIFMPVFLLGAGGVLLVDGLLLYRHYQFDNNLFYCLDIHQLQPTASFTRPDIHEREKYGVIEFTGVVVALFFYVSACLCTCA